MPSPEGNHQRLGAMLKELRTRRGFSVRTLAAKVGFSPSFISQIEADAASPSITSLEKIASALGVTLGQLFSSLEQNEAVRTVVRSAERTTYASAWSQATIAVLSDPSPERSLSALELVIAPGGMSSRRPEARAHDTFATVLSGAITLITDGNETVLDPGDSAYLPAGTAFALTNFTDAPATLLLVGTSGRVHLVQDVLGQAAGEHSSAEDIT